LLCDAFTAFVVACAHHRNIALLRPKTDTKQYKANSYAFNTYLMYTCMNQCAAT
jgi:hypothetical protein